MYDLDMQAAGRNQWSISHKGLFYNKQTDVNKPYCKSSINPPKHEQHKLFTKYVTFTQMFPSVLGVFFDIDN